MPPPDMRILLAELDTADAMLKLAEYSIDADLTRAYSQVALCSYKSATGLMAKSILSSNQENELQARLEPIRKWLEAEGLLQ